MGVGSILLVEDDEGIREMLAEALTEAGFAVRTLALAERLFETLRRETPDVIVLDLSMPRGSLQGMEALTLLRQSAAWRAIPVIVVSAFGDVLNRDVARRLGVTAIIGKPLEVATLVKAVREAVPGATASS